LLRTLHILINFTKKTQFPKIHKSVLFTSFTEHSNSKRRLNLLDIGKIQAWCVWGSVGWRCAGAGNMLMEGKMVPERLPQLSSLNK
jgi:hypothetical protein